MVTGNYSINSIKNYLAELRYFFSYYVDKRPSLITMQEAENYLQYLANTLKCSYTKIKMASNAIAFFYRHVRKETYDSPTYLYKSHFSKLPAVMTLEEVKAVICSIGNVKQRFAIALIYSTGIRISEVINIKMEDISVEEGRIKIVDGKGRKDRFVQLSKVMIHYLEYYKKLYAPSHYLLQGQGDIDTKLSPRTIQEVMHKAVLNCNLQDKKYTVHTLRHSYATHLVEQGTDIHAIQELLGHQDLKQTMRYIHLSKERFRNIENPIDGLFGSITDQDKPKDKK
jgi:integrase/recombinase XerD